MDNFSLGEYLTLLAVGNRDAFVRIYEEMKKPVYTVIFRIVSSREAAEDVTQDFFIKLYKFPPKEKIKNPRAWLFRVARNMAIDYLRSNSVYEELCENISYENNIEMNIDLENAISRLERTEREIITLHLNCDLTFSEISGITELSLPSVYRRYRKAVNRLRVELQGG